MATPRGTQWNSDDLWKALEDFKRELEAAGLRESSVATYVGRTTTLLGWLDGDYVREAHGEQRPRSCYSREAGARRAPTRASRAVGHIAPAAPRSAGRPGNERLPRTERDLIDADVAVDAGMIRVMSHFERAGRANEAKRRGSLDALQYAHCDRANAKSGIRPQGRAGSASGQIRRPDETTSEEVTPRLNYHPPGGPEPRRSYSSAATRSQLPA
jgi:hypothetical protein